jgi:hypothetical protein
MLLCINSTCLMQNLLEIFATGLFQKIEEKKPCLYVHGYFNIHNKMVYITRNHNLFLNENFQN